MVVRDGSITIQNDPFMEIITFVKHNHRVNL